MEVANFLRLRSELVELCQNNPATIEQMAAADERFRAVCMDLSWAAVPFEFSEREASRGIIAPVNQEFTRAWRDHQRRFSEPLAGVFLADLGFSGSQNDSEYAGAYNDNASAFESLLLHISDRAEEGDDEYRSFVEEGLQVWRELKDAGLDISGVLRRSRLTPTLFVPPQLAGKVGATEILSLYSKWSDIRIAFVFGAVQAAAAMCRATLETTLRIAYNAQGWGLESLIKDYENRERSRSQPPLPVHRLKLVGDAVLHWSSSLGSCKSDLDTRTARQSLSRIEAEVAGALLVIRSLVEAAPLEEDTL